MLVSPAPRLVGNPAPSKPEGIAGAAGTLRTISSDTGDDLIYPCFNVARPPAFASFIW